MKKYALVIAVLTFWAGATFAQSESARTLTVVGSASTQIMADNVHWTLTVTVKDSHQDKLRARANEILSQVRAAVNRLGLDNDDMVFGKVTITMRYKQKGRRESDEFSHYELSQRITLIQEDVQQYDEYWHELTAIEGVQVRQNFFASQLESTSRQLRIDALRAAKQKADDLAAIVGDSVGKALSISEFAPDRSRTDADAMTAVAGVRFVGRPEEIKVSANLYVVFELQ